MNVSDIRLPVKLTTDVDFINIDAESTSYKVNLRAFAPEGVMGANVNILGTKQLYELNEDSELMGWCEDVANKALILFIKDGDDTSFIMRYFLETQQVQQIINSTVIKFTNWITADVVGDMLYWTDGYFSSFENSLYTPPQKLNITKALNIGNNAIKPKNKYGTITRRLLNVAKATHTGTISVVYDSDGNTNRNYLRNKLFQFRIQNIYDDKEQSAWSNISEVPLPENESNPVGYYAQQENVNNFIGVSFNTGDENVVSVNVAYREGNFGNWRKFYTLNKYDSDGNRLVADNITRNIRFAGNEVSYALDNTEVERMYHDVPIVAKKQRFIDGKNMVYANYLSGYGNVSDVDLTLEVDDDEIEYSYEKNEATYVDIYPGAYYKLELDDFQYECVAGDLVSLLLEYHNENGDTLTRSYFYTVKSGDTNDDIASAIVAWGQPLAYEDGRVFISESSNSEFNFYEYMQIDESFVIDNITVTYSSTFTPQRTFKSGSNVEVGIVYYDEVGRCGGVNSNTMVAIPFAPENYYTDVKDYPSLPYAKINVTIDGTPPEWAYTYQLVVSPKQRNYFQYLVDPFTRDTEKGMVKIRLNDAIGEGIASNSKVTYGYYTFKKRDRVRIIGRRQDNGHFVYSDQLYDFEIIDVDYDEGNESYKVDDTDEESNYVVDSDGNKIKKETAQYLLIRDFDFESDNYDADEVLIEVYSPEVGDDTNNVFYEIGQVYQVYYISDPESSQRVHATTSITLEGDSYVRPRVRNANMFFMCEDTHFSDMYESNFWNRGRANVYNENSDTRWYKEYIKHSKAYFKDSYNGLSDFNADQINLSSKFGEITALNESGFILQVKQETKDSSIYIGRLMLNQPSEGAAQLTISDKLLGTIMPSQFNYGTVFPKSVAQTGRFVYYFDVYNGIMVRDAYNGPAVISDFGMKTYFKQKGREILAAGIDNCDVLTAVDSTNDEIIVTFDVDGDTETVVFNEKQNVWSHFATFEADGYAYYGDTLLALKGNKLWLHNGTSTRNNFYGTQYDSKIRLIFNKEILKNKIFHSIQIKSLGDWLPLEEGDIGVYDEAGVQTMFSFLPPSKFVDKEGAKYATFLRNMGDLLSPYRHMRLMNGEVLRGRFLVVDLTNESTDKAWIAHTVVNSIYSEKS